MKILIVVPDVGRYGGTNRFLERLLVIHARHGINTMLLVPIEQCNSDLALLATRHGVELILLQSRTSSKTAPFLTLVFDFFFIWRTVLTRRPNLVVVSTGNPGRVSVSMYFPVPVLYVLHSIPEQRFRLLPRIYLWLGSMLNNRVMTVSHAAAESIVATMGVSRSRVDVVYNSCVVAAHKSEVHVPLILTVGHLVPYKNPEIWLDVALRVLQKRPNTFFVWLGDGELLEAVRDKLRGTFHEKHILLPGYVQDPSTWYLQTQIYFQPSLMESHGIAVLEAMSFGIPCVVANSGGLPESVVDGETGYVCSVADSGEYADRIVELIDDAGLCKRLGTAGQRRVESIFSEDIQEHKIMTIYNRLMH